jgi:hypothetical protein
MNIMRFCKENRRSLGLFLCAGSAYSYCLYTGGESKHEGYRLALAGSAASLISEVGSHGLDTVSTRAKFHHTSISSLDMAKQIFHQSGSQAFFRGISPLFYGTLSANFVYFGLYKEIKPYLLKTQNETIALLSASLLADFFTYVFYYPIDVVKTKLQTDLNYTVPASVKAELNQHGIRYFYKGYCAYTFTCTTSIAVNMTIYEKIMRKFH